VLFQSDFPDAVTLSCVGFPGTCSFSPNPVTGTTHNIDSTFQVSAGAGLGTFQVTIRGTGGALTRNLPVEVTIRDFALTCAAVLARPGTTVTTPCWVTSLNGFDDPVALACSSGGCTWNPATVTPPAGGVATSLVTFSVGSTPGTYSREVSGLSHGAYRLVNLPYTVDASLVFADNFEQGSTQAWTSTTP
jgi:hypothetical protein